mmetsp:Transcript_46496/g.116533  ORF Transcript_46496/g.116533 Transcript_46496/m.116533 type:complete len:91 (+) Transcript_46496:126-398(+)
MRLRCTLQPVAGTTTLSLPCSGLEPMCMQKPRADFLADFQGFSRNKELRFSARLLLRFTIFYFCGVKRHIFIDVFSLGHNDSFLHSVVIH